MGTYWVAISIKNIKIRASREMTSILMRWTLPSTGMWQGEVFAISHCLVSICIQGMDLIESLDRSGFDNFHFKQVRNWCPILHHAASFEVVLILSSNINYVLSSWRSMSERSEFEPSLSNWLKSQSLYMLWPMIARDTPYEVIDDNSVYNVPHDLKHLMIFKGQIKVS